MPCQRMKKPHTKRAMAPAGTADDLALGLFVTAIYAAAVLPLVALYRLACNLLDPWGMGLLLLWLALLAIPLTWTDGPGPRGVMRGICATACAYFPITVKLDDEQSLKPGESYVLGYEPHSALPVG